MMKVQSLEKEQEAQWEGLSSTTPGIKLSRKDRIKEAPQRGQRRKRTTFNKSQFKILSEAYERDCYPDFPTIQELAKLTQVPEPRIQLWFQNRRARKRKLAQKPSVEDNSVGLQACAHRCPCQQGLQGAWSDASQLFSTSEANSGQADRLVLAGVLTVKVVKVGPPALEAGKASASPFPDKVVMGGPRVPPAVGTPPGKVEMT
ncbi:PREDICTED: retinal homeobox protein Rx-A-like [Condylura cristata]|uniref:retinal homeobox protein Rx-A-like n=1 Tax=Condylura cristata TaxID=143302 RepID=UPI000643E28B|nr:PREDICTED: retinal homeobox protein Rx-A-like [Condylura cristata]